MVYLGKRLVGPAGLEPATKGFTNSTDFSAAWTISSPRRTGGCGTLLPVIKGAEALR
jgi:hypothetical protein